MEILKQTDGSSKVVFDDGLYFFVEKGKDPIDGVIDISLEQKKTAAAIENRFQAREIMRPELFFVLLFFDYNTIAWRNPQNKNWYDYAIHEYNREIKRQQLLRERKENKDGLLDSRKIISDDKQETGRYQISWEYFVPKFVTNISTLAKYYENASNANKEIPITAEELEEQIVAIILLNLIYCQVDLRKIEARISEIKGLCRYLELIAPDAFLAYCALGDRIGFNAALDVERYYRILDQLDKK